MNENTEKPLSNWLVVSDIDGTLNNKLRFTPQRNIEAITHFVEMGGHFTLASGRNIPSLKKHFDKLPIASTPAIVFNGAAIYDFQADRVLWKSTIGERGREIVGLVLEKFPAIEVEIFRLDRVYLLNPRIFGPAQVGADHLPHRNCRSLAEVPQGDWCKVIFLGVPPLIRRVVAYIESLPDKQTHYMSSSIATYEMLNEQTHKGVAVQQLAKILGIEYEHTAAIGDYFNDADMLRSVYLPAACGQAPAGVHALAKFHACHCNHGAVADFLHYIENVYQK